MGAKIKDWEKTLGKWSESNMTKEMFCRLNNISTSSFYKHLNDSSHKKKDIKPQSFIKAQIKNKKNQSDLTSCSIELTNGTVIKINDISVNFIKSLFN